MIQQPAFDWPAFDLCHYFGSLTLNLNLLYNFKCFLWGSTNVFNFVLNCFISVVDNIIDSISSCIRVIKHASCAVFLSPEIQTNGLDFQRHMVPTTSAITNAHAQALLQQVHMLGCTHFIFRNFCCPVLEL